MPIDKRYDRVIRETPSDEVKLNPAFTTRGYLIPGETLRIGPAEIDCYLPDETPIRPARRTERTRYRSSTLGLFE